MYWEFVIAGYAIVFGGVALYAANVLRQGRALSKKVPPERRRFLD
ncbi:MAG: hypothetical protein OEV40_01095 [Acidimicrobiia bacterium]|nr:hypothetical protein [Acidimicrobiia bacterium]